MSPTSLLRGIAFLLLLQWVSTLIINALGVPFPPALLGMLILTAGVSVILYVDVIKAELLPITVTIVVCSIVVLAVTAFFIEAMLKGKESQ